MRALAGAAWRPVRRWVRRHLTDARISRLDLKASNQALVRQVRKKLPYEQAMAAAVGGDFDAVGAVECALVRHYGLPRDGYLIDVGCGSGRLAKPLAGWLEGRYLGIDLVADLVDHARAVAGRDEWRFAVVDHIGIPAEDGCADMVCFFSVLTHLLHEQSYWYLEEAKRVLKPGGRILFSFLEYGHPRHWQSFLETLRNEKEGAFHPLNVFIDRGSIPIWAEHLGLRVGDIRGAADVVVPEGALGQSLCALTLP